MSALQMNRTIGESPVALPAPARAEIGGELDRLVADLYAAYHFVKKHHWIVEGPQRQELHLLLDRHASELLAHADAVAERYVDLGGVPTSSLAGQRALQSVEDESEGRARTREMLAGDVRRYVAIAEEARRGARGAERLDDLGTRHLLEGIVLAMESKANDLADHLAEDTLAG